MTTVLDKRGFLKNIDSANPQKLELGCGNRKRHESAIGIDIVDYPNVDVVGDVFDVLRLVPQNSIEDVYAHHFIEHVSNVRRLLLELSRVMCRGGSIEFVAPHFSNPYFYSDPTHRSTFGLYTFHYMAAGDSFRREVPNYQNDLSFSVERVDLCFKSSRAFPFRYLTKYLVGLLFNSSGYMKELYEENFCYIFPCYEVRYLLRKN